MSVPLPSFFPSKLPLLLAFDLDRTLVSDQGDEVPVSTIQALHHLRAFDVSVAVITGRDRLPQSIQRTLQPDAIATNNGGRVEVCGDLHTLATFSATDLHAVLAHELEDARVAVFTKDRLYVDLPQHTEPEAWMRARQFRPLSEAPMDQIVKVGFYHTDVSGYADRLRQSHPHLVYTGGQDPYPHFLTVTPTGAHKAAALITVADALHIPHQNTIAFGDSDNDKVMLEVAAFAVQVGTLPLLQPLAHAQIESPQHIGQFLERIETVLKAK